MSLCMDRSSAGNLCRGNYRVQCKQTKVLLRLIKVDCALASALTALLFYRLSGLCCRGSRNWAQTGQQFNIALTHPAQTSAAASSVS